jgi:hypothetical protein
MRKVTITVHVRKVIEVEMPDGVSMDDEDSYRAFVEEHSPQVPEGWHWDGTYGEGTDHDGIRKQAESE